MDSLELDPRFRKYKHYLELWREHIKDQWAEGEISGEIENACAFGKAQLLKDQVSLNYADIREFFVSTGKIKEKAEDGPTD